MTGIIQRNRSIIPACDVPLDVFEQILEATADVDGVGAYKIPARAGRKGWETWVSTAREYTTKPLVYDHQKAGTDIPDTGEAFMEDVKGAGFDAVILFPQSGPVTEEAWIKAAQEQGLGVIVGGLMTHKKYLESDGGWITSMGATAMYEIAADLDVSNFVVPGNKPGSIKMIRHALECGREGLEYALYAPGFVAQGGEISEGGEAAGDRFHAIVGRGIYWNKAESRFKNVEEMRAAAIEHASQI